MKQLSIVLLLLSSLAFAKDGYPDGDIEEYKPEILVVPKTVQSKSNESKPQASIDSIIRVNVVGQGVSPSFASSPAQSYALAKRAATADAYRLLAERVRGVNIDGSDTIKNMAVKNSTINTKVQALIRNAKILETTFKNGLCEVEMEVLIDKNLFR